MNRAKLRGKIREVYGYEYLFAKALGLSNMSMSSKLNGKSEFKHSEILEMAKLLKFSEREMIEIFFNPDTKKS